MEKLGFNTKAIHVGELIDERFGNVVTPIFQNATFLHPNESEEAYIDPTRNKPYLYTRLGNPTLTSLERKIASLENAIYTLSFSSGMSAISASILSIVKKNDSVLAINQLYGQTYEFFLKLKNEFSIDVDFVSVDDINSLNIPKKNYKLIYVESITNPTLQVVDLDVISKYAIEIKSNLIVDATFATPYNQRPLEFGARISVHSGTKYISGHSDVIIGLSSTNSKELYMKLVENRNNFGSVPDPFCAYLTLRGTKTLGLRMERHQENALKLAKFLKDNRKVANVFYPGLEDNKYNSIARKVLNGFGGMLSFELKGGYEAAKKFLKNLKICIAAPSLGGVETLVTLPIETSHRQLSKEEMKKFGISEGLVRVSIGIEDYEDIEKDFSQAMDKI